MSNDREPRPRAPGLRPTPQGAYSASARPQAPGQRPVRHPAQRPQQHAQRPAQQHGQRPPQPAQRSGEQHSPRPAQNGERGPRFEGRRPVIHHNSSHHGQRPAQQQHAAARSERAIEEPRERAPQTPDPRVPTSPFTQLGVNPALVQAVLEAGYDTPTPIQAQTIPIVLQGRDLLGCAQTGTGKTAAFLLPLLQRLGDRGHARRIRALVLSPTRELAAQIGESARRYGRYSGFRHTVIYGGVSQRAQERELDRSPEVVIATPGRLLDLMQQGLIDLSGVEIFVLDEADTMLDMGFIHDVRRIVAKVPKVRQTLLFSATMPGAIRELSQSILNDPLSVSVSPQATTADTVEQAVYFVAKLDKHRLLKQLLETSGIERALVFTRTKHGADRVARGLVQAGLEAAAIHGNKSQNARERALEAFRRGTTPVLVATDIAARGIDVQGVSHVFNYDLPNVAESYVHRIGRTGRAGALGSAISFCDREEKKLLMDIERLIRRRIRVATAQA